MKGVYCQACFQAKVASEAEAYERTMELARDIDVYFKDQGKETRLIRRDADPFIIKECHDRDELILRLAFLTALNGFNTLIDVDVTGRKVRDGSFQKTIYSGLGVPANARPEHVVKDRSIRHNPN